MEPSAEHPEAALPPLRALGASIRAVSPLTRPERWALLGVVGVAFAAHLIVSAVSGTDTADVLFQGLTTLVFAVAVWSPPVFAGVVILLAVASLAVEAQQEAILALAIAAGIVMRTCSTAIRALYLAGFVGFAVWVHLAFPLAEPVSSFIAALIVAVCASIVGVVLRAVVTREIRVRRQLLRAEQARAEVVLEERRRVADDLHDIVAHDLVVISMHARLLERAEDEDERRHSERAIIDAARQALGDLRRVVMLVGDTANSAEPPRDQRGIVAAMSLLQDELRGAGFRVETDTEVDDEGDLDRLTSGALARIVREAGTNILKHAADEQPVAVALRRAPGEIRLSITNGVHAPSAPRDRSGSGYGLMRMRERAELLSGTVTAGPHGRTWRVEAVFPAE